MYIAYVCTKNMVAKYDDVRINDTLFDRISFRTRWNETNTYTAEQNGKQFFFIVWPNMFLQNFRSPPLFQQSRAKKKAIFRWILEPFPPWTVFFCYKVFAVHFKQSVSTWNWWFEFDKKNVQSKVIFFLCVRGETKMFLLRLIRTVATGAVCVYAVCFKSVSISLDYMIIAGDFPNFRYFNWVTGLSMQLMKQWNATLAQNAFSCVCWWCFI